MGEDKKIESIFDVKIETGERSAEIERVIVEPNPDKVGVLSVFLKKGESKPRKYYDLSLGKDSNSGLFELLIEGDDRIEFVRFAGSKVRLEIKRVPEQIGNVIVHGWLAYLERSFTKLKIEVTPMILFTAT